jgi:hypothetical protein
MKRPLPLRKAPSSRLRAFATRRTLAAAALLGVATALLGFYAQASNPSSATINPTDTAAVEWVGTAPGGASAGEASCVDGVNCDTFKITVGGTPADWASKLIALNFSWSLGTNDYDFYIHKDTVTGPSTGTGRNGGAPETTDNAAIDPAATGVGDYIVHVVYFSVVGPADQYRGSATVAPKNTGERVGTYDSNTGIAFSPNVTVKAPVAARDGEPSVRTDYKGNSYTGGIRGVPAGVDLWYFDLNPTSPTFDPQMRVPIYRGQPDGFTEKTAADVGGDGGGDIDLAVGFPPLDPAAPLPEVPTLAYSSLTLANIPTGRSRDRALTFEFNNAGNLSGGPPGDDRQWHEFLGSSSVYLLYRTVAPAIAQIQRSNDGGFTYGPAASAGLLGQVGCIDVHQASGTVYASGSNGVVAVGEPSVPGTAPTSADYTIRQAAADPAGVANIFFVTKVADDGTPNGTVYVVYSNGTNIYLKSSVDKGGTWSERVQVNPPTGALATKVNLFPWMETGKNKGSVGIVWYGTTNDINDDNAQWKVYYAQSFNADTASPHFRVAEVTEPDHFIHGSNISTGGLLGPANRNLIDYFQISFDPQGAAVIAYTDDHNDFDGHTYVARQVAGTSINNTVLPAQPEGAQLALPFGRGAAVSEEDVFPPRQPGLNGEQVTDFELDVQSALVTRVATPDAVDIESVRYDTSGTVDSLAIAATMRVTDLTVIPTASFFRASFTANAPRSIISADGTYSYGISDDGDQFYVQADVSDAGSQSFSYGTAVRESNGAITYNRVGDAIGEFNPETRTISIQVSAKALNDILSAAGRPLIGNGSVIAGLRARAVTADIPPPASRQGRRDITRGGTQFTVYDSAFARPAPTPSATPLPPRALAPGATPAPTPPEITLANISTRVSVGTGQNVGIAGFIVSGNEPKRLMIRGIGPSLKVGNTPVAGRLENPVLEIRDSGDNVVARSDDWRGTATSSQQAEITASGLAPTDDREAAVIVSLSGGDAGATYTAVLSGAGDSAGIGLVEVYDLDAESFTELANISTRGSVGTGDNVMIGGIIVRDSSGKNQSQDILVRGIGPSLSNSGVTNPLQDPQLTLVDIQGNAIAFNDDFDTNPQGDIRGSGLNPTNPKEAAIRRILAPSQYTFILNGAGGSTGIGLVEAYNLGNR